jgi:hypothetical protein
MARNDKDFNPFGKNEPVTGRGEVSQGVPPRQIGGAPGFGPHGMGYAHSTGDALDKRR